MVFLFSEAIGKLPSKTIGKVLSLTMGNVLSTTIGKVLAFYKYIHITRQPSSKGLRLLPQNLKINEGGFINILRHRIQEDMRIRNLSSTTRKGYLDRVAAFANYFNKPPALLEAERFPCFLTLSYPGEKAFFKFYQRNRSGITVPVESNSGLQMGY